MDVHLISDTAYSSNGRGGRDCGHKRRREDNHFRSHGNDDDDVSQPLGLPNDFGLDSGRAVVLLELAGGTEAGPPRRKRGEGLKKRGRSDTGMVGWWRHRGACD